jgi:predicted nuclease with TOPRIM domain
MSLLKTGKNIQQERDMLKITLEYLVKENKDLRQQLEDMRMTVRTNKDLLKEYIDNITNKDKVVMKMNNTIEQLQTRLANLEDHIREKDTKR